LRLLRVRLLSVKNSLRSRGFLKKMPFLFLGLGFSIFLFYGTLKAISFVRGVEFLGEAISRKLLSMTFFSLMGFLFLSNIVTSISVFYLSADTPFLRSLPIKKDEILRAKGIETFIESSWMTASFVPPLFIAYGVAYGAGVGYYLVMGISVMAFMGVISALSIIISHIIVRVFPSKGMRDMVFLIGLIVFILAYMVIKGSASGEEALLRVLSLRVEFPFLPSYWASEALWVSLRGGFESLYINALISSLLFFFILSLLIGNSLYDKNLELIRPVAERARLGGFYPSKGIALVFKDIKLFLRDTSQWSQLVVIGALVLVYVYNFKALPLDALSRITPLLRELVVLINLLMTCLVISAVGARFSYPAISLEGQAFWAIRSSPLEMERFLKIKFLEGLIPVFFITILIVFASNYVMGIRGTLMYMSLAITAVLSISISGLGTGFGALYPKFRHENTASISMSMGGLIFMLSAFAISFVSVFLLSVPFYIYYKKGGIGLFWIGLSALSALSINILAPYLALRAGAKRLKTLEE